MSLPTCFVVTGFGVKTDPSTGRALNLDKTFKQLVQPACDRAGINAFRAIDANVTGSIDAIMYRWIYEADYVIADLSTLNANVFYELGVRHAQRPHTTVIIAETLLMSRIPFDLSSFVVHEYDHGGDAITAAEQTRFVAHLSGVLGRIKAAEDARLSGGTALPREADSPVFKFLTGMQPPDYRPDSHLHPPAYVAPDDRDTSGEQARETLAALLDAADAARREQNFEAAKALLEEALAKEAGGRADAKPDPHILRQLVLVTYKAGEMPNAAGEVDRDAALDALQEAELLLQKHCAPNLSTDPETLGLAGAINKRVFELTDEMIYLERAIGFYERGFYIKQDYYNGINAAFMHTIKATRTPDVIEATVSYGYANMLRRKIIDICTGLLEAQEGADMADLQWIYATLAEANQGLGNTAEQSRIERMLDKEASAFAKASYYGQKAKLSAALEAFNRAEHVAEVLEVVRRQDAAREARDSGETAGAGQGPRSGGTAARPLSALERQTGRISVIPEIEPGRPVRSVEITCRIEYD